MQRRQPRSRSKLQISRGSASSDALQHHGACAFVSRGISRPDLPQLKTRLWRCAVVQPPCAAAVRA